MRTARIRFAAALVAVAIAGVAHAGASEFAAAVDRLWDYDKPAESEARFRAELARWPDGSAQHAEVLTQIARTQGLRRMFADANATLDAVERTLATMPSHVRVRYLLERGRTLNSAGAPERAVPLFEQALDLAQCAGDDFYAIDAAHMLGIAAPQALRLDWDLRALAMAQKSADPRARRWNASLLNNIGYAYQERGDYANALVYYRKALHEREARGDAGDIRVARWMVARAQRSLGQLDAAERTQRALAAEYERIGEPDGYVFEELAEIALARGDARAATPWAAKAYPLLAAEPGFADANAPRLARLAKLAGVDAKDAR